MTGCDEQLALLDGLIYADTFGCAATLDELWRYARVPVARDALRERLRNDPGLVRIVVERDGLYALADRPELLEARPQRLAHARALERRAHRVAGVLRRVPFVRGVALTGSAAAGNAGPDADVDVLTVVATGRLATVFVMLGSLSRLFGRRVFCPNYYLSEECLAMEPGTIYFGHELAQSIALAGSCGLSARNPWLADLFPNDGNVPDAPQPRAPLQALLEAPLRGPLGARLEAWANRVAEGRLRAHYAGLGQDVPADVAESFERGAALRFHGLHSEEDALAVYSARRAEIAARLADA